MYPSGQEKSHGNLCPRTNYRGWPASRSAMTVGATPSDAGNLDSLVGLVVPVEVDQRHGRHHHFGDVLAVLGERVRYCLAWTCTVGAPERYVRPVAVCRL